MRIVIHREGHAVIDPSLALSVSNCYLVHLFWIHVEFHFGFYCFDCPLRLLLVSNFNTSVYTSFDRP